METRRGHISQGVVVLDEPSDVPEGTQVTVIIGDPQEQVVVSDGELEAIDVGLAEAAEPGRIDARAFLLELQRARR